MSATQTNTIGEVLRSSYGSSPSHQIERYERALRRFRELYGSGPVQLFRAPGRVNFIGEHTDYNHGFVVPAALDKDILLLARTRGDRMLAAANSEADYPNTEFLLTPQIEPAERGDWSNYLRGAAQMFAGDEALYGVDLLYEGEPPTGVPRSVGLSSSSALVVATAVALAHQLALPYNSTAFAQACADAEWFVGARGGIMDHFAALLTRRDHALFLDCQPTPNGEYTIRHIPFPTGYALLVVDSGVRHDNIRGEFNLRVAACRAGVALLRPTYPQISYLRDVQQIPWAALAPSLPETVTVDQLAAQGIDLGDIPGLDPYALLKVKACCRHVWSENKRVLETLDALAVDDVATVGKLLTAADVSARDDYAISTPELDFLVAHANSLTGVAGARLTGVGWGGCVLILVEADAIDQVSSHVGQAYEAHWKRTPGMFLCQAAAGAGYLGTLML